MIHPDASLIESPAIALLAMRFTASIGYLHTAPCVRSAVVPVAIIGGASDGLAASTAVIPARVDREICAATMIDPDAVAVVTPTVALGAG